MTLRNIAIVFGIIVAAIVAIVAVVVFLPKDVETKASNSPSGSQKGPSHSPLQAEPLNTNPSSKTIDWKRFDTTATNPENGTPAFSAKNFEDFIAKHGDTPANLIAVFEQSGKREWLDRALSLHPDSPIVLVSAITDPSKATDEQRREWIDKLKAVESNNPVPWILSSNALFKSGQKTSAIAEASAALERPAFYTYVPERIAAAQALYESSGMHPLEAELMGTVGLRMSLLSPVLAVGKALEASKTEEGSTAHSVADAARIQFGLGKIFQTPEASRLLISQLVGVALEKRGLAVLPAAERERRKAEIEIFTKSTAGLVETVTRLTSSRDEERLAQYARRLRTEGELSAMRWLQSQEKK